jgi:hypothetical protein
MVTAATTLIPRSACSASRGRQRPARQQPHDRRLDPLQPLARVPLGQQHLLQQHLVRRVIERLLLQPAPVHRAPGLPAGVRASLLQQQRGDRLALAAQVLDGRLAGPHQVAHRLVRLVRHPDRRQPPGPQQACKRYRIAPVGLHPVAGPARDERGRHHRAGMAERHDLAVEPVPGRAGLVADVQPPVPRRQTRDQPPHSLGAGFDLAEVAHLAPPAGLGHRHRVLRLCRVDPDEDGAVLPHGSSSSR